MTRFSDTLTIVQAWLQKHRAALPAGAVLVRDLFGRVRLAFPSPASSEQSIAGLDELHAALGAYSPGVNNLLLFEQDMVVPEAIFEAQDAFPLDPSDPSGPRFIDRLITGADWLRTQFVDHPPRAARATFYGLKGGVGRSTALSILARHLAAQGKRVLVLDMDFESPGVGSLLLPHDRFSTAGLIDWFVEDAVGQADEDLLEHLVSTSPLGLDLPGDILVSAAYGFEERAYIPKLSRVTLDIRRAGKIEHFADRINRLLESLEARFRPGVVLLDSRAGLHDIAAIALARLNATAFLFAAPGDQTWQGYRLLFRHWQAHYSVLPAFRENLRMVDALVPEQLRPEHRSAALNASYALFAETIYEEATAGSTEEVFNFALNDEGAPHSLIPIYWRSLFQGYNPVSQPEAVSPAEIDASYGDFLRAVDGLLPPTSEP